MNMFVIPARKFAVLLFSAAVIWAPSGQQTVAQEGVAKATPSVKTFSQQDLDELPAPITLYPDALLAQVLMAATHPLEVVEAARWVEANPNLKGKEER